MTENGVSAKGESKMSCPECLHDTQRVNFYRDYINAATDAVRKDGVCALCNPMCSATTSPCLPHYHPSRPLHLEIVAGFKIL